MTKNNHDEKSSGNPPAPPSSGAGDLSPAEKQIADNMGISYETYGKRKAEQELDNNPYSKSK